MRAGHHAVGAVGATNTRNDDGEVRTHANGRRCPVFSWSGTTGAGQRFVVGSGLAGGLDVVVEDVLACAGGR